MRQKMRHVVIRFLAVVGMVTMALALAGAAWVAGNRRDAPPPDIHDLMPAVVPTVPANENGWYCIREAVHDMYIPASTSTTARLLGTWTCASREPAHELLASNALALAWIDRLLRDGVIAPPPERVQEDANLLGWSPISKCGHLLRFRAWVALNEGRTNDALDGYAASIRLARLYLACPPANELDALAAFTEIRDALLGLRRAGDRLDPHVVRARFDGDLRALSDLRDARQRASANALANDREQLELLRGLMLGTTHAPPYWGSVFSSILPNETLLVQHAWLERQAIHILNQIPPDYRLQKNRTLALMASVRRGEPLPSYARNTLTCSSQWSDFVHMGLTPLLRLFSPNGLGEIYVMSEAGRQAFIDGGARLAECGARGTRLVLALRLYEHAHGQLPDRLDALVPEWIEAVPLDPYHGRPFHYLRDRRLVYVVGPNRRDHDDSYTGGGSVLFFVPQ